VYLADGNIEEKDARRGSEELDFLPLHQLAITGLFSVGHALTAFTTKAKGNHNIPFNFSFNADLGLKL
jgi:hypothetical protein